MANKTYFYRERKEIDYTMMDNTFLRDKTLSAKAKGIFSYMLSLPDNWKINITEIVEHFTDGLDSMKSGVRELKSAGYLKQEQKRNESGSFGDCVYFVIEKPQVEKPLAGKPLTDEPLAGNPPLIITDSNNNGIKVITDSNNISKDIAKDFDSFWILYPKKEGKEKAGKAFGKLSEKERASAIAVIPIHTFYWKNKYMTEEVFDKTYIPLPATWLNGKRWEDILDPIILKKEKTTKNALVSTEITEYGNEEIYAMQKFLRQAVGLTEFKDSNEIGLVTNCYALMKNIGKEEFQFRLRTILEDPFKAKNCNKLEYLYGELKSFIHSPVVPEKTKSYGVTC